MFVCSSFRSQHTLGVGVGVGVGLGVDEGLGVGVGVVPAGTSVTDGAGDELSGLAKVPKTAPKITATPRRMMKARINHIIVRDKRFCLPWSGVEPPDLLPESSESSA